MTQSDFCEHCVFYLFCVLGAINEPRFKRQMKVELMRKAARKSTERLDRVRMRRRRRRRRRRRKFTHLDFRVAPPQRYT